jgi:hypothetical protein
MKYNTLEVSLQAQLYEPLLIILEFNLRSVIHIPQQNLPFSFQEQASIDFSRIRAYFHALLFPNLLGRSR